MGGFFDLPTQEERGRVGEGCQSRGGLIGLARSVLTEMARTRAAGQHVEPMGYSTGPTP